MNRGENIMTILKKPHYSDLALENRAIILGKLKPKDREQFKDFIESYEKSVWLQEAREVFVKVKFRVLCVKNFIVLTLSVIILCLM